jgi:L-iditol 2-dehydrogenase
VTSHKNNINAQYGYDTVNQRPLLKCTITIPKSTSKGQWFSMKALTLTRYKEFEFGDAPDPDVGATDVLVAIHACGICGSDIHGMDGRSGRRVPPIIMGHEAAGVVAEVGDDVTKWKVGDRVAFDSIIFCGKCEACVAGRTNLCTDRRVIGVSCDDYRRHGAFAELLSLPQHVLFKVPDDVTFEQAAFGEPLAVAMHAVNRVNLSGGETALVIGAGLIGLLVAQVLKQKGASRVFVSDLDADRLALAKKLSADDGWNAATEDVVAKIRATTDGRGADVVIECVGAGPTIGQAVECVRNGGTIGCVGNLAVKVDLPLQQIVTREIAMFGSCASSGEYSEALEAVASGDVQVEPLISAVADLSEGNEWFQKLYNDGDFDPSYLKVILKPNR